MKKRLSWAVWPGLALLAACSMQEGRGSLNPSSASGPEAEQVASGFRASELPCTLTQGFWKTHPEAWPTEGIMFGGAPLLAEEGIAILSTEPRGDATYILAHQLIAAKLNVAYGAADEEAQAAIDAADAWFVGHALGSRVTGDDREMLIAWAETLDEFNNGLIGPGPCDDDDPTPLPTPTPSPSPTPEVPS